ncbi:expressed unknown protein [Seminavis robusta]|uniref:Uncharacterized protein n=1 Tax=Seminavis robusta TaxID=568900 RepID=A0A9N8DNE0_9STRA|nr:expressed unknown protein [Seminavis robusta]|eukprot:Sro176_g077310.1 n/a (498) ;mRNA; r:28074-29567
MAKTLDSSREVIPPRTHLLIDLDEGDDTEELTMLFHLADDTRANVTKVEIQSCSEEAEDWVDDDWMSLLFSCLGELENLEQLRINLGGMSLPVRLLAHVMNQSLKLQMLCVDSVSLLLTNGGDEDGGFEALSQAVRGHASLACVCLSDIQVDNRQPTDSVTAAQDSAASSSLEPFLVSLAMECPDSMRILELEDVPVSAVALTAMASSPYLRQLELWDIPSVNDTIADFASCLTNNRSLEKLELCQCNLGPLAAQELTLMLQNNNHALRQVLLDIDWGTSVMFAKPIASILRNNQRLTDLHLICRQEQEQHWENTSLDNNTANNSWSSPKDKQKQQQQEQQLPCTSHDQSYSAEAYAEIICHQGIARNTTLKRFGLEFRQPRRYRNDNSRLAKAFTEPLWQALSQSNRTVLEEFSVMGGHSVTPIEWGGTVAFFLGLNRGGLRQKWLSNGTTRTTRNSLTWMVDTLQRHSADLSTLFYLLSVHPHLLPLGTAAACDV